MNQSLILTMAIQNLCPDAQFSVNDFDLENINWIAGTNVPSANAIRSEMAKVQIDLEAREVTAAAKKAAAEAKLAALGLTSDDLKALGLGGN